MALIVSLQFHLEPGQVESGKEAAAYSLEQLAELLKEKSGATTAKIDPRAATFTFTFRASRRGAVCYGGSPWLLLEEIKPVASDPRHDSRSSFCEGGFRSRMSESDAANEAHRSKSIREATGLVWRQFLLRDSPRAVATGEAVLLARIRRIESRLRDHLSRCLAASYRSRLAKWYCLRSRGGSLLLDSMRTEIEHLSRPCVLNPSS